MERFSSSVKSFLCEKSFEELGFGEKERVKWKECCAHSFLRSVFLFLAKEEEGKTVLSSDREAFLELIAFLLIRTFDMEAKVLKRDRGNRLGAILSLPLEAKERVLKETEKTFHSSCDRCRILYVRAAYLSCGTILDPQKGYHAAFRPQNERAAKELCEVLLGFGVSLKEGKEGDKIILYLKESTMIEDLLSLMGAQKFSLNLMDLRIDKEIRANLNRRQNFDNANMKRAINGSQSVISAIRFLEEEGVLETLSEPLQKAAKLRLSMPEVSLVELCRFSEEEITKSGLNHRFQKLTKIAEKIKEEKEL